MTYKWSWERTDAGRPGMSGDIAKLFRHEEPKAPGVFALDPLPAAATLLAREVIQNSWDAARELQRMVAHAPQFQISFRFRQLRGERKRSLVASLDLRSLAERVAAIDRAKVGLTTHDCLATLDSDEPLLVLEITESAATGMYGPWIEDRSHMYLALLSLGYTEKSAGAGGSYGYGKAGLINASRIRSVVAYTCFLHPEDPGVTRRLLGVTYWGAHDYQGVNHPGIATFSKGQAGAVRPFENEEADSIAAQLGLALRSPSNLEDLGTTFLLIDPPIRPHDLVKAIERSWWPAILEGDIVATVIDYDGNILVPRPMRDDVLQSFIEAWEIAAGRSLPGENGYFSEIAGPDGASLGKIGLVADLNGWSYAEHLVGPGEDEEVSHRSLVALTRGPKMVVEYLEVGRTPPHVRGVFIADPDIDDLLRQTEPKTHDSWRTRPDDGEVAPEAAAVAGYLIKRIKERVGSFRRRLKPRTPPPEDINLPFLNDVMRRMMAGSGQGLSQPVHEVRPISIRLEYVPQEASIPGFIQVKGSVAYSLSEHFRGDESDVIVTIQYRFIEDDRLGDHAELRIVPPAGFSPIEGKGRFSGRLRRGEEAWFQFESAPYDANWTGRLIVNGDVAKT